MHSPFIENSMFRVIYKNTDHTFNENNSWCGASNSLQSSQLSC